MSLASVTVDTTAGGTLILAANGNRRQAIVKSLATNTQTVYLSFDAAATAPTAAIGLPLAPGDTLTIDRESSVAGNCNVYAIKGITASGSADIRVQES